jgi:DNA-directed RNA polymerase subunit RPC12/RpoP
MLAWVRAGGALPSTRILIWLALALLIAGLATMVLGVARQAGGAEAGTAEAGAATPGAPRQWRWVVVAASPIVYIGLLTAFAFFRGGSIAAQVLDAIPMSLSMLGISMLGATVTRRGPGKYCTRCGYELSPEMEAESRDDSRCPECGARWLAKGGTVKGKRTIRKGVVATALVLAIAPFAFIIAKVGNPVLQTAVLKLLPTDSLISEVTAAPRGFTMDEWAVLSTRTLSPIQKATLAEGLLDLRAQRQYLSSDAEGWMEAEALAGTLPQQIRHRYFSEMFRVWIDAPDRAKAGQPLSIGLGSEHRGTLRTPSVTTLQTFVCFAGFRTGDGTDPASRGTKPEFAIRFGRLSRSFGKIEPNATPGPTLELSPAAGPLRITAEYWLVVAPPAVMAGGLTWNSDGSLAVPAGSAWTERITVTKDIVVEP